MKIAKKTIEIPIVREGANVPIINGSAVTPKELVETGPHVRSALAHIERKIDFMGRWSSHHNNMFAQAEDKAFPSFFGPSVVMPNNSNFSGAQKELLLWHNKLGILMPRVQELMRAHPREEPNGANSTAPQIIKPKIPQA